METKFFECTVCGNIIMKFVDSGVIPFCCDTPMSDLEVQETDTKVESHLPQVQITRQDYNCGQAVDASQCRHRYHVHVTVGEKLHPMNRDHHICFIYLETRTGGEFRFLPSDGLPEADFCTLDHPTAVYAYCNLHGLWKYRVVD